MKKILLSILLTGSTLIAVGQTESNTEKDNIVFTDLFDTWSHGMPSGWTRLKDEGDVISEIPGGGIMFSGDTKCAWDIIGKGIYLPSGSYSISVELYEQIPGTLSDHLILHIDNLAREDALVVVLSVGKQTVNFTYSGNIQWLRLDFAVCKNIITGKVKSITIKQA